DPAISQPTRSYGDQNVEKYRTFGDPSLSGEFSFPSIILLFPLSLPSLIHTPFGQSIPTLLSGLSH
ncbi:uncharacterized protein N7500_008526, partial [Penicillium coprophilum]|uniref:uncharacterized protein n=1 Tax=Penicillium coprophilum TaxID=36646 RepID=UPI00239FEF4B